MGYTSKEVDILTSPWACTRVFNVGKPNVSLSVDDKLSASRKHNFLFTPSQVIDKHLCHVHYRANDTIPDPTHYNYLVPFFHFKPKTISTLKKNIVIEPIEMKEQDVELSLDIPTMPINEYIPYKE
ncbi:uncharacterized protein OCT59_007111 [Rhizophagus irregularis]|uniref:uncharacterized protein n=1 Tax=Rhizophagus irregularis TaxID=588596 RepID=UPI003321394C|nr:hypothetical protein OCT59_007111 [Rhizophagus irregularis]